MTTDWHSLGFRLGAAFLAYGLGSIPFGLILTRLAGLGDIRAIGSGNIGATNVLRTGRRGLAALTLSLDGAKGVLAVALAGRLFEPRLMPLAALCVVVGHCFPLWLGFKGGKGVATGLGAMIGLDWLLGGSGCLVWLLVFAVTRISSAGALSAFAVVAVASVAVKSFAFWVAPVLITALVFWRHRANISRLLAGTEPRVGRKRAPDP